MIEISYHSLGRNRNRFGIREGLLLLGIGLHKDLWRYLGCMAIHIVRTDCLCCPRCICFHIVHMDWIRY